MDWDTLSFDCYGTLVDWEAGIGEAFQRLAGTHGLQLDRAELLAAYHEIEPTVQTGTYTPYRSVLRETARRVAERFELVLGEDRLDILAESLPNWPVFPDTRPALERLGSRFDLAILSNIEDDLLEATIDRVGVGFDWTVTAQAVRTYKPDPAHFREALHRLGGKASRLLHVAQSVYHDIEPATALGLSAVWVNRKREAEVEGLSPVRVVYDLHELADWLGV